MEISAAAPDSDPARGASWLDAHRSRMAQRVAAALLTRVPADPADGERQRARSMEEAGQLVDCLRMAVAIQEPALFVDHVAWLKAYRVRRGEPASDLASSLEAMHAALQPASEQSLAEARAILQRTLEGFAALTPDAPPALDGSMPHAGLARAYLQALRARQRYGATLLVLNAVAGGVSVRDIYLYVVTPTQREIGRLWQRDEMTVAEEHYCTAITQQLMSRLYPHVLPGSPVGRRVVVAAVTHEQHEIPARMVADFFALAGWDSVYLGANTPPEGLPSLVVDCHADLVALSGTMTRHVPEVANAVTALRADPRAAHLPVIVGGHPFNLTQKLWRYVGANGWAPSAGPAVELGRRLVDDARAKG